VGDAAVAITQQATIFCAEDPALQSDVARWLVVWQYSLVQFCSGAANLDPMAKQLLREPEAALYDSVPNKFTFVELKLRRLVAKMKLPMEQFLSVDAHMREGWQCVRSCSTIKQTALPYALTLVRSWLVQLKELGDAACLQSSHSATIAIPPPPPLPTNPPRFNHQNAPTHQMCTGFIEISLIILPAGFIGSPYLKLGPAVSLKERLSGFALMLLLYLIVNLLLLGADEVASQMEDPFEVLPLNDRTECVVDLIRR